MAAGIARNRTRPRPARPVGLIAACGLVLVLGVVCAVVLFSGVGDAPPQAAAPTVTSQSTLPLPPASKPAGSLKLPPRPPAVPSSASPQAPAQTAPPATPPGVLSASSYFRVLPAADRADLIETTTDGQRLPKISESGWMPWIAYARRYNPDGPPPRVGLLVINVGADEALMKRAVDDLPGEISLAFLPSTPDLARWLQRARERGHETYLMLPVEDPAGAAERGIKPLEASVSDAENVRRLRAAMARGEGYAGFVVPAQGPVARSKQVLRPLVQELADRGLAIVEINPGSGTSPLARLSTEFGAGYARSSDILDYKLATDGLDANLDRLVEWVAKPAPDRLPRHAFGVIQPQAAAIDAVTAWRERVAKQAGVSLVPIIGHFECRDACMSRVRRQPLQLRP